VQQLGQLGVPALERLGVVLEGAFEAGAAMHLEMRSFGQPPFVSAPVMLPALKAGMAQSWAVDKAAASSASKFFKSGTQVTLIIDLRGKGQCSIKVQGTY
jgi:hypothetical protein